MRGGADAGWGRRARAEGPMRGGAGGARAEGPVRGEGGGAERGEGDGKPSTHVPQATSLKKL